MTFKIYVEGGGSTKATQSRCRRGFAEYCKKVAPDSRLSVVACGSRHEAYNRFKTSAATGEPNQRPVLLVDSEGAVEPYFSPAQYLKANDEWDFDHLPQQNVFLMVQAMEAWFLADRASLTKFYGTGFRLNALPGDESHIEAIRKDVLELALVNASRAARSKGQYHKMNHAFAILPEIDPRKVEAASPHAAAFHRFLRST